jgi:hypothetical protein
MKAMGTQQMRCDVLVIGGGAAGVAAAAAAGRAGAQVVLLDRYGFLGGLATAGLVGTVCGLYLRDAASSKPAPVAAGFPKEFSSRLEKVSGSEPMQLEDGLWLLPFSPRSFEQVADMVLREARNVTPVLHATVADVGVEGPRVSRVRALAWNEVLAIHPKCVVDCSGEATAVALAGGAVRDGSADQAPALVFVMENADCSFTEHGMLAVLRELRRAVEQGRLAAGCERLSLVPGTERKGRVAFKINLKPGEPGQPAWHQVTAWERGGRALIDDVQRFLIGNVDSFRHAHLSRIAAQLGVRTGRRIQGLATLNDEDVLGVRKFADGIARGCWPMESWSGRPRPTMTFFEERDYYEIPFGCLRPAGLDNVLAAGRCISAMPGALASARVIGTCLATGWAAGIAAAMQAAGEPMEAAVNAIRARMIE